MSRIDDLIKEHCPDGVKYTELGEVCDFQNGFAFKSKFFEQSGLPILRIANIQNDQVNAENLVYFNKKNYTENLTQFEVKKEDILVAMSGATTGKIGYVAADETFYLNQRVGKFIPRQHLLNNRFLFHYLLSKTNELLLMGGGGAQPNLSSNKLMKFKIPLPPLPVQQEIVDILDAFTKLEAELEAELEARQQQYTYYRDELLNFDGKDVPFLDLDSVCVKTSNIKWKEHTGEEFEYIDLSSVDRGNNQITETQKIKDSSAPSRAQQIVLKDDIIFGTTRPTLKRFCVIPEKYDGHICSTGFCVLRANKNKILPRFLFFSITTSAFDLYVERNQEGAGYPAISNSKVKSFQIPVPPLEEQKRIVNILDKFDALVNDISSGLPAEITARRQQYEHYRNRLLTFKEAA